MSEEQSEVSAGKAWAITEFLLTYGWAILAAIIAIGVMAYFGVFSYPSEAETACLTKIMNDVCASKNLTPYHLVADSPGNYPLLACISQVDPHDIVEGSQNFKFTEEERERCQA